MVTITLHCLHCGSEALVRDGHAPNGKQKYRCHACGRRSRENPTPNAYPEARREEILHAYQAGSSLRGLTRTFGISRATVSSWITKKELSFLLYVPPWSPPTQRMPLPPPWNSMRCGHWCLQKRTTPGCGIALCRQTRQVVASAVGDRSKKTCQQLWENIPDISRAGHCFTDFWAVYPAVIPKPSSTQQ